jgi:hypothetical protein
LLKICNVSFSTRVNIKLILFFVFERRFKRAFCYGLNFIQSPYKIETSIGITMKKSTLALCLSAVLLHGCGGDSSSTELSTPSFSLSVSDAPVENAVTVVACFSQIELKSSSSANEKTFLIGDTAGSASANDLCTNSNDEIIANTRGVDLLSFTGSDSTPLLNNIEINPGDYNQIRLVMSPLSYATVDMNNDGIEDDNDQDGNADRIPIRVPSNELKLDGFTATLGGVIDLTIEFDLRKGMTNPVGQEGYILKPRGVRIVDNTESGHIEGMVSEELLMTNSCEVVPEDLSELVASVYVYSGVDLDSAQLADNGGSESIEPLTSAPVFYDGASSYNFQIGFVRTGDYTLALTCSSDADPEGDDDVDFFAVTEVSVGEDGATTEVSFVVAQ